MANIIQINGFGLSGGGGSDFPYTGSAIISGSLIVTGSTTSTLGFTGSLFGTSSWATNTITASFLQNNDPNGLEISVTKGITLQVTDTSIGFVKLQAKNIELTGSTGTTITSYGNILPGGPYTNNTSSFNLGSPTAAWKDIYVSNGSINFISGSNSSSIQFDNGQITFSGANLTIPSGSAVLTASLALTSSAVAVINDNAPAARYVPFVITSGSGTSRPANNLLTNANFSYIPASNTLSVTSSWANNTTSSSFAVSSSLAISSSFATTASYIRDGVSFAGSGSIITGSTAISSSYGLLVPANTFTVGDLVKVQGVFLKPNGATSTNFLIYINTTNQLSGATQVAIYNTTTIRWSPITRTLSINSPTRTQTYAAATSHYNDDIAIATGFTVSNLNIDWTVDQYFLFAAQNATLVDRTDTLRFYAKKI